MLDPKFYHSQAVLQRLDQEAEGGPWSAVTYLRDGKAMLLGPDGAPDWAPDQFMFASDMAKGLNNWLHHDGFWIVGWTHPSRIVLLNQPGRSYTRMVMIWFDQDGDPGFTVESEDSVWKMLECGPRQWAEQAEQAWQQWERLMHEVLDPREGQTFKRAQGQTAPSQLN
ncbi:hypothetical protein [Ferrovibrio sp.]|uniref:hypothetical protein n=1 Tax=Ferrovibrio sp. TaxID=1917215 RepID=UPI00311DF5DB